MYVELYRPTGRWRSAGRDPDIEVKTVLGLNILYRRCCTAGVGLKGSICSVVWLRADRTKLCVITWRSRWIIEGEI